MKFAFIVLTYNHEEYIIEHLESIKYQIQEFGQGSEFQIIIADDGSRDRTVDLAQKWITENRGLFFSVKIMSDGKNHGTCHNYTKTWALIECEYFKITAGDDVYSCIDIFKDINLLDKYEIVSGMPLLLVDGSLSFSFMQAFNIVASDKLYRNKEYLLKLKRISISNAPNIFFPKKVIASKDIECFINRFHVTEDFPLHIKMSELFKPLRFKQLYKPFVYYRRTGNSTYLVQEEKFNTDKASLYSYLISSEKSPIERYLLKNRLICYRMKNRKLAKLLNLGYYLYALNILINFASIIRQYRGINKDISRYQEHMDLIHIRSLVYLN